MDKMAITKRGFLFILIGVVVMALGYLLLAGGGVKDPQVFNYSMFDFRRLVLAPLVIIAGVVLVILGIMGVGDKKEEE